MALNQAIIRYIRNYQKTYTQEAITQELLKAGFDRVEIETVWQTILTEAQQSQVQVEASEKLNQVPNGVNTTVLQIRPRIRFWLTLAGYSLAVLLMVVFLAFWNHLDVAIAFLIVAILAGTISANMMFSENRGANRAISITLVSTLSLLFVISVVFPFVILVIVAGLCVIGWSIVPW